MQCAAWACSAAVSGCTDSSGLAHCCVGSYLDCRQVAGSPLLAADRYATAECTVAKERPLDSDVVFYIVPTYMPDIHCLLKRPLAQRASQQQYSLTLGPTSHWQTAA
jgi:hypothetical protein